MADPNPSPAKMTSTERLHDLIVNAMMTRQSFMNRFLDPRRSIDDECGFPKTGEVTPQAYRDLYDREGVATRVVEVFPKESWQGLPEVYEDEEAKGESEFDKAWRSCSENLDGEGWRDDQDGSSLWEHLLRLDILSGIGHFGILLLGIDDGLHLEDEVKLIAKKSGSTSAVQRKLMFLRAFDESLVQVTRWQDDPKNPRYGLPLEYLVQFNDPANATMTGIGIPTASMKVNWTRVVHAADNRGSSNVLGVPRMRPVLNRLLDLRKLYGGSAEMYWKGAFPGLSFETHPQLGGDVSVNSAELRDEAENYQNSLQRILITTGMVAKPLAPQVVDPTAQINTQLEAICIQLGIPKRVFMGSERGELASSQDDASWNDRLRDRQSKYVTPRIIAPFVDRLIQLGVLPQPEKYTVKWPDLDSLSDAEKADIAVKKTQAFSQYVSGGIDVFMAPADYLTRVWDYTTDEAEEIEKSGIEHMAAANPDVDPSEIVHGKDPAPPPPPMVIGKDGKPAPGAPPVPGQKPGQPPAESVGEKKPFGSK